MPRKYTIFALVSVVVVTLDQLTKWWVRTHLELWRDSVDVIPGFFELVHYQNTGAAFGVMQDDPDAMTKFAVFTLVALTIMLVMVWRLPKEESFVAGIMGLIMGGAVGNAIDRAVFAAVTDFLRFYTDAEAASVWLRENFGSAEWPSFNIADSAIVVGIIVFFVQQIVMGRREKDADLDDEELPSLEDVPE
ncbi:MAG TPA: signal peptidase II [Myxococcota bacterium]|nr:signal peptidase II [Myxococcota bacterium]